MCKQGDLNPSCVSSEGYHSAPGTGGASFILTTLPLASLLFSQKKRPFFQFTISIFFLLIIERENANRRNKSRLYNLIELAMQKDGTVAGL